MMSCAAIPVCPSLHEHLHCPHAVHLLFVPIPRADAALAQPSTIKAAAALCSAAIPRQQLLASPAVCASQAVPADETHGQHLQPLWHAGDGWEERTNPMNHLITILLFWKEKCFSGTCLPERHGVQQ